MGWAKQVEVKKAHPGGGSERGQSCGLATSWQVCQGSGKRVPQGWPQKDRGSHDEMKRTRDLTFRTSSETSPEVEVSARTESPTAVGKAMVSDLSSVSK